MGGIIDQFVVSQGVSPYGFNVRVLGFTEGNDVWFGCVLLRDCRSNIVMCIPLVLRVRAVMAGWV